MISRRSFSKSVVAAGAAAMSPALPQTAPKPARIKIDTERVIGDIDPKLYGNFVEHLGRCVDGGVFQEGSPLSDANGYRKDVFKGSKDLKIGLLRWPGGNFSSNYHWKD